MKTEIKNRWNGRVLFDCDASSFGAAVKMAISAGADLTRADLTGADLTGAKLTRADLTGANLTRADLTGADLTDALVRLSRHVVAAAVANLLR